MWPTRPVEHARLKREQLHGVVCITGAISRVTRKRELGVDNLECAGWVASAESKVSGEQFGTKGDVMVNGWVGADLCKKRVSGFEVTSGWVSAGALDR